MTRCAWSPVHAADPDPAELALEVGEVRKCRFCRLFYRVARKDPYRLERAFAASALVIEALAEDGKASVRERYAKLLKLKQVQDALADPPADD